MVKNLVNVYCYYSSRGDEKKSNSLLGEMQLANGETIIDFWGRLLLNVSSNNAVPE